MRPYSLSRNPEREALHRGSMVQSDSSLRPNMPPITRRHLLRVSALGLASSLGAKEPKGRAPKMRAKSVIFLHQWGGPSQHDTFDMKPSAPAEVRGELKPIRTPVPGLVVSELLPRMARLMDRVCLVRSLRHTMKNHNSAGYYSLTGYAPPTDDQRLRDSRDLFPASTSGPRRLANNSLSASVIGAKRRL